MILKLEDGIDDGAILPIAERRVVDLRRRGASDKFNAMVPVPVLVRHIA